MRIGLDFDGVIAEQGEFRSRGAKELFGVDLPPEKSTIELAVQGGFLTEKKFRELESFIYKTPFGFSMEPVRGALLYIPILLCQGHEITVITARTGVGLDIAKEWLHTQDLVLDFVGVGYGKSKAEAARGLDVYADDYLDVLANLTHVVLHRFLFSWGYNRYLAEAGVATRVSSWHELYAMLQKLKEES